MIERMTVARGAAVVTWSYAAGFGLSTLPVAVYLQTRGRLPSFLGLFDMYGGPWSARLDPDAFVVRLGAFSAVTAVAGWSAWWIWRGRKAGAILNVALIPIEAVFWLCFALPLPWLAGIARIVLLATAWRVLDRGRPSQDASVTEGKSGCGRAAACRTRTR